MVGVSLGWCMEGFVLSEMVAVSRTHTDSHVNTHTQAVYCYSLIC